MTLGIPENPFCCPGCAFTHHLDEFEICVCCGFQKDVDDGEEYGGERVATIAQRWILGGMRWWSQSTPPPAHWDPEKYQLPWLIARYGEEWQE